MYNLITTCHFTLKKKKKKKKKEEQNTNAYRKEYTKGNITLQGPKILCIQTPPKKVNWHKPSDLRGSGWRCYRLCSVVDVGDSI
jgi:hypothetical protein